MLLSPPNYHVCALKSSELEQSQAGRAARRDTCHLCLRDIPSGDSIGKPSHSSSSLSSSSSSLSAAFLAGFFRFFLLLLLPPVDRARGCSKIFSTSSSVILFSVLYCARSGEGGAASRVRPFFVMAEPDLISLSSERLELCRAREQCHTHFRRGYTPRNNHSERSMLPGVEERKIDARHMVKTQHPVFKG